ncbi:MAG TPA: dienelactone hydrolase family protein [Nitrososphaerales archaeon]|nr:dienelactone hydrolase family protein [Nitrososphaerales archaeon]
MSMKSNGDWSFFLAKGDSRVGVVLVHEIFGYNSYVEDVAKKLASDGYTTAAVDLFRGAKPGTVEEGRQMRNSISDQQVADALAKGADLMRRETPARKIGSMGFCMGGGVALQGACDLALDFCVDYYGMITEEKSITKLRGPVLLILGSDDERVTPWAFQKLLPAAAKAKKRIETQLYPGAMHAFHRPGWAGYNEEAATDAYEKTVRFLSQFK